MRTDYIDIDNGKWGIVIVRDFYDTEDDWYNAEESMRSFGMTQKAIRRACKILDTYNSGMTITRDDLRMSIIFIGRSNSRGQFWNTVSHELHHVATAIEEYYGVDNLTEPSAYLHGHLLQRVVEVIAEPCHD